MTGTEYTEREDTPLGESRRKGQGNTPVAAYDSFSILRPISKTCAEAPTRLHSATLPRKRPDTVGHHLSKLHGYNYHVGF
jgi:hypothetical protein